MEGRVDRRDDRLELGGRVVRGEGREERAHRVDAAAGEGGVELVGHHDTVFAREVFAGYRAEGDVPHVPGVVEMKGRRVEGIMDRQARGYTDAQLRSIADYLSTQPGNGDDWASFSPDHPEEAEDDSGRD